MSEKYAVESNITRTDGNVDSVSGRFKMFRIPRTPRILSCHPYLAYAASLLCMIISGTQYAFSAYAPALKTLRMY